MMHAIHLYICKYLLTFVISHACKIAFLQKLILCNIYNTYICVKGK